MRRRYSIAVLAVLAFAVLTASGDDFWVKKDWTKWSKADCDKMLQDSPWTRKWSQGQTMLSDAMSGQSGANAEGAGGETSIVMDYYVELLSALPVRQAVVRQAQIAQKYDQMDAAHKKAFDDQSAAYLSRVYDDVIVVHVRYRSSAQAFERDMAKYWQSIPDGTVPTDLYMINQRNERIDPIKFVSPHTGAYVFDVYFPRMKGGEPVIQATDKKFSMQFIHPAIGTQTSPTMNSSGNPNLATFHSERALVEFNLDKMKVAGKLNY